MVDIQLRKRALTKAGYEVVPCENPKGYHLRLPDGTYLSEHWTGLPDWFKTEELAWRAAPAVETSVDLALFMLKEIGGVLYFKDAWCLGVPTPRSDHLDNYMMVYEGDNPAVVICEAYLFCELVAA